MTALREAVRFVVVDEGEAMERGWLPREETWGRYRSVLFDTSTTPPTEVGSDGGEPEDQLLCRDWSWVPELCNRLAREADARIAEAVRAERERCARAVDAFVDEGERRVAMRRADGDWMAADDNSRAVEMLRSVAAAIREGA